MSLVLTSLVALWTRVAFGESWSSLSSGMQDSLVTRSRSTEFVTLRYADEPNWTSEETQTNCPWDDTTLVLWESAATWGGAVPSAGSSVTLPADTRVLVTASSFETSTYGLIQIPSTSALVFSDEPGIHLHTTGILVEGELLLGSETCRMQSGDISITLHGSRPSLTHAQLADLPRSNKGIHVMGTLDVHGKLFHQSWTRLAQTASAGSSELWVQHAVNWEVGQQIVVVTSEFKDARDWHHNEVVTVASVTVYEHDTDSDLVVSHVTIVEELDYTHYGGPEYQVEVGLLSRNILIQGAADSEPTDVTPLSCSIDNRYTSYPCENTFLTGYGGHVFIDGSGATGRVRGAELYRMGQTNVLTRYPWHVHVAADGGSNSYATDNSVHHSFYRCFVIHGSNNVLVSNNVAYDAIGHCYYLEDGVEMYNTLSYNLGAHIHFMEQPQYGGAQYIDYIQESARLTNPADVTASAFYITNLYNTIVGNSASGGWSGWAIVSLARPIMLHQSVPDFVPEAYPTLEFDGNVCHSSGWWWGMGGCMYIGGQVWHDSNDNSLWYNPGRSVPGRQTDCSVVGLEEDENCMVMTNTKIFLSNWGLNNWGQFSSVHNIEVHDTMRSLALLGYHWVSNFLAACHSAHTPEFPQMDYWFENRFNNDGRVGFEWYDTGQRHVLSDSTFRDCSSGDDRPFRVLTHSDEFNPDFMQATKTLTFEPDVPLVIAENNDATVRLSARLANWLDYDGTASGRGVMTLLGNARNDVGNAHWWHLDSRCDLMSDNEWWACDMTSPNGNTRTVGAFQIHNFDSAWDDLLNNYGYCPNGGGNAENCPQIGTAYHMGSPTDYSLPLFPRLDLTGPINGRGWYLEWDEGTPVSMLITNPVVAADADFLIAIAFPVRPTITVIAATWCWPGSTWTPRTCEFDLVDAASVAEVMEANGDKIYYDGVHAYFKIVQTSSSNLDFSTRVETEPFVRDGVSLPSGTWANRIQITSGCTPKSSNPAYCEMGGTPPHPANICQKLGRGVSEIESTYDDCLWSPTPFYPTPTPPTPSPTPMPTPAPSPPPSPYLDDMVVYDDSVASGWSYWGWANDVDVAYTGNTAAGSASMRFLSTSYEAIYLHYNLGTFSTSYDYRGVEFWLYAHGDVDIPMAFALVFDGDRLGSVRVDSYFGAEWVFVQLDFKDFAPSMTADAIWWQSLESSGSSYVLIDEVTLVNPRPTPPPVTAPTNFFGLAGDSEPLIAIDESTHDLFVCGNVNVCHLSGLSGGSSPSANDFTVHHNGEPVMWVSESGDLYACGGASICDAVSGLSSQSETVHWGVESHLYVSDSGTVRACAHRDLCSAFA